MKFVQMFPLAIVSITLYVAVFHLYMYARKLGNRTNLSFAAVCLYMFLHALICLMNYNAGPFEEHLFWLKLFYVIFPLFPAAIVHFAYDFTGRESRKVPWSASAVCLVEMLIMGILCLTGTEEKEVLIPVGFLDIVYVAFQGSPAMEAMKGLVQATVYIIALPSLNLVVRSYRAGNRAARPILIGAFLFLLSGVNDTLVETSVYAFLYLSKFGGLCLILGMAYAMIDQMAKNQQEINQAKALTAIGRMATEVVHDLTTPLDAIKLAASIAKSDGNGSDTQERYLSMIEKETRRLSDLSFDILHFVNKDRPLTKQRVNLNDYMQEVIFLIQADFDKHQIALRYVSDYDGDVNIDPDAFKRVILNLAGNSRESLIQSSVEQPEFVIRVEKQARQLLFSFNDNGQGIPESIICHIFDSFTTYGKANGSGLGLPISKQIVNRHGGSISCRPGQKQGAAFLISLPA